ncbi:hypothetical protein PVAND_005549 [Polypedilum vanderplanki]|uniref:Sphingomyelin synthase-like domain-containing protein n=1 Tax=Polypedilum vanderplanki TaxID=319348 RepID=A0A9J6C2E0_POLVA|nr:hypothetical protein PVAND_005549 [Polypedilum vanderplanki]
MQYEAVSGAYVENLSSTVNNHQLHKSSICDNENIDINEENETENNQFTTDLSSHGMLISQSFYSKERFKVLLAFIILVFSFFLSTISLILTHNRLPDDKAPLPDLFLDNIRPVDFLLYITEIQIIVVVNICIITIFFHKKRLIVAKRCFLMLSILYCYRAITMTITVLPISSKTYYCSPQKTSSLLETLKKAFFVFTGLGLSINGQQKYCGDSIFSGHSTILIFAYLVLDEYLPKKFQFLKKLALLNALAGMVFLLISHSHYSIDVLLAYYVTTRLFWTYHQNINLLMNNNLHGCKEWWFGMFKYFEKNTARAFTNEFEIPWHQQESQI